MRLTIAALLAALAACGEGDTRRVTLVRVAPAIDPLCGAPPDGRTITIIARGDFPPLGDTAQSEPIESGTVDVSKFPETTRVLEVLVEGIGGEERTIGRTRELDFAELADGDELRVFMAPRRGFCPVDPMQVPRRNPLVARAGTGVLVAGGYDADGDPVDLVERYDPDGGAFVPVDDAFYAAGLPGASMTRLPDGRVVVVGGPEPAYQVYDPGDHSIGQRLFLEGARAYHAAAALPDGRLLLAGGCAELTAMGACEFAEARLDSVVLEVESGTVLAGPSLAVSRAGGVAIVESDGRILLAGGIGPAGEPVMQVERIDLETGVGQGIVAARGRPALLASGAIVVAFADGAESDAVAVIPPAATSAVALTAAATPRSGATLTSLEDGTVLAVGGVSGSERESALFVPALEEFSDIAAPFSVRDHAAVRLDDGSVLVLGGRDEAGVVQSSAWIYRHDLTGRFAAQFALGSGLLTARDPARVSREPGSLRYTVSGSDAIVDGPSEWVVGGGPQFVNPAVSFRGSVNGGGLALMFGFESPRDYVFAALQEGEMVRVFRVDDGIRGNAFCSGTALAPNSLSARSPSPRVEVQVTDTELTILLDDMSIAHCEGNEPIRRGAIGAGVLGGSAASLVIEALTATR